MKTPSTVLVTGDRGFIGTYIVEELLSRGHIVIGVDNDSKYGPQSKAFDNNSSYYHYSMDARNEDGLHRIMYHHQIDRIIFGAALIGGISYFHRYPYTLLATNEQIMAGEFNAAIRAMRDTELKRVLVVSSSMVYENVWGWPSYEGDELNSPPPTSSYGFQKLAMTDFLRDMRGAFWMNLLAGVTRNKVVRRDVVLAMKKGFTVNEMKAWCEKAGMRYVDVRLELGYRFSLLGERAMVLSGAMERAPGLAGA
jgi:nucleoside-diphosphate-sugar epimerase